MTLSTALTGGEYLFITCDAPMRIRNKLETLGLVPGEQISVIQNTRAGIIIEVKQSRLAIAHDLARSLFVSSHQEEAE